MKITLNSDPLKQYVAYNIYWGLARQKKQRLFCIIEDFEDDGGFTVIAEDECSITDDSIEDYVVEKGSSGMESLRHRAAYTSTDFLYSLVHHEDGNETVQRLLQNMKDMGLEP
jgi:hypothetical protein